MQRFLTLRPVQEMGTMCGAPVQRTTRRRAAETLITCPQSDAKPADRDVRVEQGRVGELCLSCLPRIFNGNGSISLQAKAKQAIVIKKKTPWVHMCSPIFLLN